MSNLDYPISLLIADRKEIATSLQPDDDDVIKKTERLYDLNKAIGILNEVKRKDEIKEREKKVLEMRKGIVNDKNIKI